MDELATRVKAVIGAQLGIEVGSLADDLHFIDDLGLDSLDAIEVVIALEDSFALVITERDYGGFASVTDVVAHVRAHAARAPCHGEARSW